jgi:hypothetical protein
MLGQMDLFESIYFIYITRHVGCPYEEDLLQILTLS